MTTDITELAQSEINDALAQLKQISEYPTPSTQYARVLRKYILALVDALEKAQQRITQMESRTVTVKLPLPRRKTADDYVDDTFEPCDLAAVYNACRLECEVKFKNALTAAGIKVEAE